MHPARLLQNSQLFVTGLQLAPYTDDLSIVILDIDMDIDDLLGVLGKNLRNQIFAGVVSELRASDEKTFLRGVRVEILAADATAFFGGFGRLFGGVSDPRHPAYITYSLPALMATGVLMFLFRLGARRQVDNLFRWNGASAAKYQALLNAETCPHGDTINCLYAHTDVNEHRVAVIECLETKADANRQRHTTRFSCKLSSSSNFGNG